MGEVTEKNKDRYKRMKDELDQGIKPREPYSEWKKRELKKLRSHQKALTWDYGNSPLIDL